MRSKRALINTLFGLGYEVVALVCAMILPRLILSTFGSTYNGITNSITQFLSCVALLRFGIGGVTKAALYKPLAEKDTLQISRVVKATEIFLRRVAAIFTGFLVVFACIYPIFVNQEFDWLFSATLVLILGISTIAQYQFGLTYQLLLNAAQRHGVVSIVQIITTIANTIVAALLIYLGAGIHVVKLGSAIVFAMNPVIINIYAKRKYKIITNVEPDNQAISQRWDAFAHQVAYFVNTNASIIILTVLSTLKSVSVYSVYYLVINGITKLVKNSVQSVSSAFGDMLAKKEEKLLQKNFNAFETGVFFLAAILFGTTMVMIVPFVSVYTKDITDANYYQPLFGILITVAAFFNCVRIPYQYVVEAAGHFKQTKRGAFFEAGMNIVISVICVFKFGLVGVAFGTLFATIFRTLQFSLYLCKHIIKRNYMRVLKNIAVSAVGVVLAVLVESLLPSIQISNYYWWCLAAVRFFALITVIILVLYFVFFRKELYTIINKARAIVGHKKKTNKAQDITRGS